MKPTFTMHILPKQFTSLGIQYDLGTAENLETKEVTSIYKISIGLIFIVFDIIIPGKKGEK